MLKTRKIKFFLRDFYLFLIFFDKSFSNIFKFIKAFIKRNLRFRFKIGVKHFNFTYEELMSYLTVKIETIGKLMLNKGLVYSDALDYKEFKINFRDKNVLDVGAWIGDSILLFHKLGAKKIIAYEPIKEDVEFAKKIIKKYGINCKIYEYAVCKEDGEKEFLIEKEKYGRGDLSLLESNQNIYISRESIPIKVRCISWKKVLEDAIKEKVDIAKVDCEGCEKYLIDIENKLIKPIKEWIIEAHSKEIAKDLIKKFGYCGFKLEKIISHKIEANYFEVILHFKKG